LDKKVLLAGAAIVILLIIAVGFWQYQNVAGDNVEVAYLQVKGGSVEVNQGSGWASATDGMKLRSSDKVRTGADGSAAVVLFEGIIASLDPNTEVSVNEVSAGKTTIKLEAGSVWNKFAKVSGVSTYEVETPNAVATVRGTSFGVTYASEETTMDVGDGNVEFGSTGGTHETLGPGERATMKLGALKRAVLDRAGRLALAQKLRQNLEDFKAARKKIILGFIERNRALVDQLESQYPQLQESRLDEFLNAADAGQVNEDELIQKSPMKLPILYRLREMNQEVRAQMALIQQYEGG